MSKHREVAGVLGGGGVKGFCHIGFLKACRAEKVSFNDLLGVSVGSLVAALHCNDFTPEEIHEIFRDRLRTRLTQAARAFPADLTAMELAGKIFGPWPTLVEAAFRAIGAPEGEPTGFNQDIDHLRVTVQSLTAWYPDLLGPMRDMVKELGLKPRKNLSILAFDAIERKPAVFSGTDYDLPLALAASCALPGAFRPVFNPNGRGLLVDGAMYHRNPVDFSIGKVLVSKLNFATSYPSEFLSPVELIGHMKEMMGLNHYHRHEIDKSAGHIVVEMDTPHVAGLSFGISRATQDGMVDNAEKKTLDVLRAALADGSL